MYTGLHVKYQLFLSDFNETWIFFCFPSQSVITYKYNASVDNTTFYLYKK